MRTGLLVVIGLLLAALAMWLAGPARRGLAIVVFAIVWLGVVAWNLRGGLAQGYSLREELPIQLLVFAVPMLLACLAWKARGR